MSVSSKLKLAIQDKRVIQALANTGLSNPGFEMPDDQEFQFCVEAFISIAMSDPEISSLVDESGLSTVEMICLYSFGVTTQLPNPLILSGGKMLAITLVFMEPMRLRELLGAISRRMTPGMDQGERMKVIGGCVHEVTSLIKRIHDSARGSAKMPAPRGSGGSGCAILLILPIGFLFGLL